MSNNEKFNQLLNSCENPRAVYGALLALGTPECWTSSGRGTRPKGLSQTYKNAAPVFAVLGRQRQNRF